MKVSELLAEVQDHHPDAPIVVSEIDSPDNILVVESVVKNKDEAIFLMARPTPTMLDGRGTPVTRASQVLSEALTQGVSKRFNAKFIPSQNPEKFYVEIDGLLTWPEEFTHDQAMAFAGGFTFGFSTGAGIKNNADGVPPRIK